VTQPETLLIVGNISLSIFFGILIGTVLAPIIAYSDQSFRKHDSLTITNYLLAFTWILVPVFTLYFAYTLFSGHYETAKALAPLGMMIAAMVASASVMKNIAETKAHDLAKSEKEKERKRAYTYTVIKVIENQLSTFITTHSIPNANCKEDYKSQVNEIKKYIKSIFNADTFPYLKEEQQNDISDFYKSFVHFMSFTVNNPEFCAITSEHQTKAISELQEYRDIAKKYIEDYNPEKENK